MAKIGAALVAALIVIAFGKILLSMLGRFFRFWLKLPFFAKVVFPAVFVVFCLHGSMKNRGAFSLRPANVATVTDIDIERGFKLESVVTNAAYSYELASNAVRNAAWHLAGGHSAFNRYNLGWLFPMGENTYDHIIAFQEGSVFHNPRDEYPLFRLYDGVLSFVPGYSDFWSLIDDQRGVFTWRNVVPYDKTNEVVSVQLELIKNGDFTIRSNEFENVYRRINPDDWDNDGLANEVDNVPKSYDGDFFGVASALPEGALESAYCWVDLCVTGVTDIATVRVTCDGPSDLGDQVIIARTNEVFRVPLLKGAYYDIESALPICVVDQSSDNIEVSCNDCWEYHHPSVSHHYLSVSYYVDFWLENNGNLCELKSSENIGAAVSDVTGACCKSDITSLGFRWCCNASCNCNGNEHELFSVVSWEGYTTWFYSWTYCGCICDEFLSDEVDENGMLMSVDIPSTFFVNDDDDNNDGELDFTPPFGGYEDDVIKGKISFASTSLTNGNLVFTKLAGLEQGNNAMRKVFADNLGFLPYVEGYSEQLINTAQKDVEFFVSPAVTSSSYHDGVFKASFEGVDGKVTSIGKKFTVVEPIVEPVCDEYETVIGENSYNREIKNPCAIAKGSTSVFSVDVLPEDYPNELITWSFHGDGTVSFASSPTGRTVRVTGVTTGKVYLAVHFGDSKSEPPQFEINVVDPITVKLRAWVIGNGNSWPKTESQIRSMVSQANDIYAQVGVTIDLVEPIVMTNIPAAYNVTLGPPPVGQWSASELLDLYSYNEGLECYIVNEISDSPRAKGVNGSCGMILRRDSGGIALSHEIGHSFGLIDVYNDNFHATNALVNPVFIDSSEKVNAEKTPFDWNYGCIGKNEGGSRFYKRGTSVSSLLPRLLMFGIDADTSEMRDISHGEIYGVWRDKTDIDNNDGWKKSLAPIGFYNNPNIKTNPTHK